MAPRVYILMADGILVLHSSFVAVVVVGLVLVYLGWWRRWAWVRNRWFRLAHAAAMGLVFVQALLGVACPLTIWEIKLRALGGQPDLYQGTFMQYWVGRLLFHDWSMATFTILYAAVFFLVVAAFVLAPPKWRPPTAPDRD